jgi:hypothetical protein
MISIEILQHAEHLTVDLDIRSLVPFTLRAYSRPRLN